MMYRWPKATEYQRRPLSSGKAAHQSPRFARLLFVVRDCWCGVDAQMLVPQAAVSR
jgi:hypothetical protein